MRRRRLAWGGVLGPAGFVAAWVIGGAATSRSDYSPVDDTISQLAQVGADTRPWMTAGMIAFGLGVPAYAMVVRTALRGPAWIAAAASGIATLGVAAAPLESSDSLDVVHAAAAGLGYLTLAMVPLLARRPLLDSGHRRLAHFGVAMGVVSVVSLPTSVFVTQTGLFQRIGLTASDLFLVASVPTVLALAERSAAVRSR